MLIAFYIVVGMIICLMLWFFHHLLIIFYTFVHYLVQISLHSRKYIKKIVITLHSILFAMTIIACFARFSIFNICTQLFPIVFFVIFNIQLRCLQIVLLVICCFKKFLLQVDSSCTEKKLNGKGEKNSFQSLSKHIQLF